ncbi:phosphatase PAP2 family protein [Deinococcus fonticola]|uniref:phosphatase PAP2 family protein n=1 Tax=Deinococcus fonticola TaxID=2528713 RepID=UPI001074C3BA|nr:phosphatase PAP2 family protein [Deinococcus fonticola]
MRDTENPGPGAAAPPVREGQPAPPPRLTLLLLAVVFVCLVLALLLTVGVFRRGGFPWDQAILDWYRAHRTPTLTALARGVGVLGGLSVLPLVTAALAGGLAWAGRRMAALFLLLSVYGAILLNISAKVVFHRPRPDELGAVLVEPGFSFPSGHAMSNAAFGLAVAVLWRGNPWVMALGWAWAFLVPVTRNYLGVHYPTDVSVGFLTSLAWVFGLAALFSHYRNRRR